MSRQACLELARHSGRDPDDVVEYWAERAAIREHDGRMPRDAAEAAALEDVRAWLDTRKGPRRAESMTGVAGSRDSTG